jgi:hypothetical protein
LISGTVVNRDGLIDGLEFDENRALDLAVLVGFRSHCACKETAAACFNCRSCEFRVRRELGRIRDLTIAGDPIRFAMVTSFNATLWMLTGLQAC